MNAYKSKDVHLVSNFAKMVLVLLTYKTVKTLLVLPIFHTNVLTVSASKKKTIVMITLLDALTTKDLNAQTDSVLTLKPTVMNKSYVKMVYISVMMVLVKLIKKIVQIRWVALLKSHSNALMVIVLILKLKHALLMFVQKISHINVLMVSVLPQTPSVHLSSKHHSITIV